MKKSITTFAALMVITLSTAFAQNKTIDKCIVGSWMQQNIISSNAYGNSASYTSVTYYQFTQNGKLIVTEGNAVASGNDWSYNNNASNTNNCNWFVQNGYIYFEQNGQLLGYTKYTLHNGQLVFGQKGNYKFLQRS